MSDVRVGESMLAEAEFVGAGGQPMAATGVTARVRAPDGSVTVLNMAAEPATPFVFRASFVPNAPGTWRVYAECTGPVPETTEERFLRVNPRPF